MKTICMKTKHIHTKRLSEVSDGQIASVRYVSGQDDLPVQDAHRDDYFIFILIEEGGGRMQIDFKEYEASGRAIICVLPGQVHVPTSKIDAKGWFMAIDSMFVNDEQRELLEQAFLIGIKAKPNEAMFDELRHCISTIDRRLNAPHLSDSEATLHALFAYYIQLIAEVYRNALPTNTNNRPLAIASRFKSLLSIHFKTLKRPSEYAALMNLSPAYLNETVKKAIGLTAGECIRQEISTQAKRLLLYTNRSIKEIALELGYEDWAYFTRIFTQTARCTPTEFRRTRLK